MNRESIVSGASPGRVSGEGAPEGVKDDSFIGGGGPVGRVPQTLILRRANRRGLIVGATGTVKTVMLQVLVEAFSYAGVRCSWP